MLVCILGRQPELSVVELERQFGAAGVRRYSDQAATVSADEPFDVQRFGGVVKAGRVIAELDNADWLTLSKDIVQRYSRELARGEGKLTLGLSVYGREMTERQVGRTGLALKQALKKQGRSVRLVPNDGPALSTAVSHHNKLGLSPNKLELMIVYGDRSVVIAESVGTQNITALARRDQGRPKRDAFVGMLPPKLALMMVNMAGPFPAKDASVRILDPFCGTGVVLQEAALLGYDVYGTDLAEKMVDYSRINLEWLVNNYRLNTQVTIEAGDAIEHRWAGPVSAVVAETYLGQPFSAPPAADKLEKVVRICNDIISKFLLNIGGQLETGTPLALAVPAWRDSRGNVTYLPLIDKLSKLGYRWERLEHADARQLVYFREDQVVARQLLLLRKK